MSTAIRRVRRIWLAIFGRNLPPPHRNNHPACRHSAAVRLAAGFEEHRGFTEFEQRAAYFDGDTLSAVAKGVNPLERGSQVHFMAEVQDLLWFPPAPLGLDGKLDSKKFGPESAEMKGQQLFFGKAQCATCHPAPYYTDNLMHDLQVGRFYEHQPINGMYATKQGPIKTFPLRGIKESPPYLHDGRLLTLEDTVEFFNLVLETKLSGREEATRGVSATAVKDSWLDLRDGG